MWQVLIYERTVDGREVASPVIVSTCFDKAKRAYRLLAEALESLHDFRACGLDEHDPAEPTGWREIYSTRRLVSPRRAA